MKPTTRTTLGILLATLALVAAACGPAEPAGQQVPEPPTTGPGATAPGTTAAPGTTTAEAAEEVPETIVIGYPASLTGQYEALGKQGRDGLQMFVDWVNEEQGGVDVGGTTARFELVFGDDRSDLDTAIRLFERLVQEDGAHFMMASYSSGLTLAEAPIAEQLGVATFAWGGASDEIWQQGFTKTVGVMTPASLYDRSMLEFVSQADPPAQTVAVVYKEDPFTLTEGEGAIAVAEELGLEVVFQDQYPAQATDLSPVLTEAWQADPDVIVVGAHFQDGALAARQMYELGITPAAASFGSGTATTDWYDQLGEAAEGTFGPAQWETVQEIDPSLFEDPSWVGPQVAPSEWAAQYEERFGYEPDYRGALAFHAGLVLMRAIEEAGTIETEAVLEAVKNLDVWTVAGNFRVDPETLLQVGHDMVTIQWQDGDKVIVAPPEAATAEARYPANQ